MKLTIPIAAVAVALSSVSALPIEGSNAGNVQDITSTGGFAGSLFNGITSSFRDMFSARLVQTSPTEEPYWTTELGKQLLWYRGVHFMDLTDTLSWDNSMLLVRQASRLKVCSKRETSILRV